MSKIVLGKGLEALIPTQGAVSPEHTTFRTVKLEEITRNPMQPRRDFDQESLSRLAESIKANGVMQPLIVRQNGANFTIIAGERRYRAAEMAGLTEVPVVVMDETEDARLLELALVENLQREDLNAIETAEGYRTLLDRFRMTQNDLAAKVGRSRAAVTNILRLLTLPESIQQMIRQGELNEGHGRALLALDSESEQLRLAERIASDRLPVRAAEREVARAKRRRLVPKRKIPALVEIESYLKGLLGTAVKIHPGLKKGRIEIEYYSDEDLERLLEMFKRIGQY